MRPSRELCCDQKRNYFLINCSLNDYITNIFKYLFMDDYLFGIKAVEYPR